MRSPLLLVLIPFLASSSAADAACPFRGTRNFARLADLPAGAAAALRFAMAERGAPFQATDVIVPGPPLPGRRFVGARLTDCRLALRYEQGGIAHTWRTAILERQGPRWLVLADR